MPLQNNKLNVEVENVIRDIRIYKKQVKKDIVKEIKDKINFASGIKVTELLEILNSL